MVTETMPRDFADETDDNIIRAAVKSARSANQNTVEPPRPLRRALPDGDRFPVEALGNGIGAAVEATAKIIEAPL